MGPEFTQAINVLMNSIEQLQNASNDTLAGAAINAIDNIRGVDNTIQQIVKREGFLKESEILHRSLLEINNQVVVVCDKALKKEPKMPQLFKNIEEEFNKFIMICLDISKDKSSLQTEIRGMGMARRPTNPPTYDEHIRKLPEPPILPAYDESFTKKADTEEQLKGEVGQTDEKESGQRLLQEAAKEQQWLHDLCEDENSDVLRSQDRDKRIREAIRTCRKAVALEGYEGDIAWMLLENIPEVISKLKAIGDGEKPIVKELELFMNELYEPPPASRGRR